MIVGSLRAGELSSHVGGVNEREERSLIWERILREENTPV